LAIALGVFVFLYVGASRANSSLGNDLSKSESEGKTLQESVDTLTGEKEDLSGQIKELSDKNATLQASVDDLTAQLDYYQNGPDKLLGDIRNSLEAKKYNDVLTTAKKLHSDFNGSAQDKEGQDLAAKAQKAIDDAAAAKAAEAAKAAAEAAKSVQDRVRSLIHVTKLAVGSPNSAGGVDLFIGYVNNSDKVIKYITFTVAPYNAVGDVVYSEIGGTSTFNALDTGPKAKGEGLAGTYQWYWECAWYNWTITSARMSNIEIEYMDGTTEIITSDEVGYAFY
jgi:uncharacterized protein YoxC